MQALPPRRIGPVRGPANNNHTRDADHVLRSPTLSPAVPRGHPARLQPWLHAGFVLAYGGAWIVFFLSRLEQPSLLEWLTVPAALVFFNWGEYRIHKSLGHHKHPLGRMFYKRHTGDHHSFSSPARCATNRPATGG